MRCAFITSLVFLSISLSAQLSRWEKTSTLEGHTVTSFVDGDDVLVAGMHGAGLSVKRRGSDEWQLIALEVQMADITSLEVDTEGALYAGTLSGRFFKSVDGWENWEEIKFDHSFGRINAIKLSPSSSALLIGTDAGLFTYDLSRESLEEIILEETPFKVQIYCLSVVNEQILAGSKGCVYRGFEREPLRRSELFTTTDVLAIASDGATITAATSGAYTFITPALETGLWVEDILSFSTGIVHTLLSVDGEMYRGMNGTGIGIGSLLSNTGIEEAEVTALCSFNGEIYAGTRSRGVFVRKSLLDLNLSKDTEQQTKRFTTPSLSAFPNPTNKLLNVDFSGFDSQLEKQVRIYNQNGRVVFSQSLPGINTAIDVSELPAGTYSLSVSDGDQSENLKIIVQ